MQFEHIRAGAAGVKECVLAVPAFYTQTQRRNLITVAEAMRFQVVSLISANTAAALYYGVERFDSSPVYGIIYNLGSSHLQVTLVRYSTVRSKASILKEKKIENIEVVAQSWNEDIGGRSIDAFIANFLADKFSETYGEDPRNDIKVRARLIQEANRLKELLSDNESAHGLLNSLWGGKDFEVTVERSLVEGFIKDKAQEFLGPISKVLQQVGKNATDINFFEVIGGASKIPIVQKLIAENFGEVSSNMNGDYVIADGAALFGTNFSSQVQIRPVLLSDLCQFIIKAEIKSVKSGNIREKEIFNTKSPLNSVKKISFGSEEDLEVKISIKYHEEFSEVLKYDIVDIDLLGQKYMQTPTVVLIFKIDRNGVVKLEQAEARVEFEAEYLEDIVEDKKKEKEDSEGSEGSEKIEGTDATNKNTEEVQETETKDNEPQDGTKSDASTPSESITDNQSSSTEPAASDPSPSNSTETPPADDDTPKKRLVTRRRQDRQDLSILETYLEIPHLLSEVSVASITNTLSQFLSFETEQHNRLSLKASLTSYLQEVHFKLLLPDFQKVLSPLDREVLDSLLASTASWLESLNPSAVPSKSFVETRQKIEAIVNPALRREKEFTAREGAVLEAYQKLQGLYSDMSKLNRTKTWIDADTRQQVFLNINDTIVWLNEKAEEQRRLNDWELPVLKLSILEAKVSGVEKKVEVIRNTARPRKEGL